MTFKILADIAVFVHFLWILFLIFGAFFGRKNRLIKIFHISGLAFAFVSQLFGWHCPLTHLEFWLRAKHSPALAYSGSFIVHYLEKLIYIEIPPYLILILTILLCGFNLWIYMTKKK
jgi:predicted branched-subunit amino acid permease